MKFKITLIVEGDDALKNDLEKGHVQGGMEDDVFTDVGEKILEFEFRRIE